MNSFGFILKKFTDFQGIPTAAKMPMSNAFSFPALLFLTLAVFGISANLGAAFAPQSADGGSQVATFFSDLSRAFANKFEEFCDRYSNGDDDNAIRLHNWGNNFNYSTLNVQYPKTVAQVQHVVRHAKKLRVIGSRHSFSKIADSSYTLLSTLGLNNIISINQAVPSALVEAGITYTDLAPTLDSNGFALPQLAALAEITVGGAISTGTHGSGPTVPNLANQVRSIQLVLANGTVANYTRASPEFRAVVVGLGAFGVITQVELDLVPSYNISTYTFVNLPTAQLYAHFDEIISMSYNGNFVSLMTNTSLINAVVMHLRGDQANQTAATLRNLYGATGVTATPTCAGANVQTWYEGMMVFPFGQSGADGNDFQTEYFVDSRHVVPAMQTIFNMSSVISPLLGAFVIRTIRNDDFYMSQSSGNNSSGYHVALQFSWNPSNLTAVAALTPRIESALRPFNARVHWGKFATMQPQQLMPTYPMRGEFRRLAQQLDPQGKFRNRYLDENVFVNV